MRLTIATMVVGLLGSGAAWMNANYASAADVKELSKAIRDDRVERLEFMIERAERQMKYLKSIPTEKQTEYQQQELIELEHEKEFLLRKLKRIEQ